MNTAKILLDLLRNFRHAHTLLKEDRARLEAANAMYNLMEPLGFFTGDFFLGNPYLDVGAALQLAEQYGITLHKGTCYGDCRAGLSQEKWRYEINRDISSCSYGTWMEQPPEEVVEISAYGRTVGKAICQCLLNCRTAGVL